MVVVIVYPPRAAAPSRGSRSVRFAISTTSGASSRDSLRLGREAKRLVHRCRLLRVAQEALRVHLAEHVRPPRERLVTSFRGEKTLGARDRAPRAAPPRQSSVSFADLPKLSRAASSMP